MGVEANKAALRRIVDEVLNRGDEAAFDELVHEDYADGYVPGMGRDEYRQLVAAMRAAFPDVKLEIEELVGEGDLVVGRFTVTGTHLGELAGIAPTGRRVSFAAMGMIRFRDGRMIERWNLSDAQGLLESLTCD